MLGKDQRWLAAAAACGLMTLAALLGCGDEPSVGGKSAASREAQKKDETSAGAGHVHEHGAATHGEEHPAGHDHGAMEAPAAGGGHEGHGQGARPAAGGHEGHAAMDHGAHSAAPSRPAPGRREGAGHAGEHAGHGTTAPQAPATGTQPPAAGHEGHAGHAPAAGAMPSAPPAPAPVAVPPEQPAKTLRPDALDAPAATSVLDAQRSAEMAGEMAGGHGGHGSTTYRHVDAGRGPEAYQEPDEAHPPGAGTQHHDHGPAETVYVCPMHPEVTSKTPGTCPKCGMTLVERRKG